MAKRSKNYSKKSKSWTKRIIVLGILALACFGGWTLFQDNQKDILSIRTKVEVGVEKAGDVLVAAKKELRK